MKKYDKEGSAIFEYEELSQNIKISYRYGIQYDYDLDDGRYRFCGLIDVMPDTLSVNGEPQKSPDFADPDLLDDLRFEVRMSHLH